MRLDGRVAIRWKCLPQTTASFQRIISLFQVHPKILIDNFNDSLGLARKDIADDKDGRRFCIVIGLLVLSRLETESASSSHL